MDPRLRCFLFVLVEAIGAVAALWVFVGAVWLLTPSLIPNAVPDLKAYASKVVPGATALFLIAIPVVFGLQVLLRGEEMSRAAPGLGYSMINSVHGRSPQLQFGRRIHALLQHPAVNAAIVLASLALAYEMFGAPLKERYEAPLTNLVITVALLYGVMWVFALAYAQILRKARLALGLPVTAEDAEA